MSSTKTKAKKSGVEEAAADQETIVLNGNDAVARAIVHVGYDGEGYYPITPSSNVGEEVDRLYAEGETDVELVRGTSELAAISIAAGMSLAGGRVVDVTSANGLLLKAEEMPAISGLGLPVVLNIATRDVSAPLNIKNGHSDLVAALGWGWMILMAPSVQAAYDMNIIAPRLAEAVNLPCLVVYDGFHTSHGVRKIDIFDSRDDVQDFVGEKPERPSFLDMDDPRTFGPYMNDDLINTKVVIEEKMEEAADILPDLFDEFAELSGRNYNEVMTYGSEESGIPGMVALNTASETAKVAVDDLADEGQPSRLIQPMALRPFPEDSFLDAMEGIDTLTVAERVSQYGAGNYLYNELGALLHDNDRDTELIQKTYGVGGLKFDENDAREMIELARDYPDIPEDKKEKSYHGAWAGEPDHEFEEVMEPISEDECLVTLDDGDERKRERVNIQELSEIPNRIGPHSACPGCGIFASLSTFLKGIEGHVAVLFNTGCGMVVTTGFPETSFKMPYFHNLFHNGSSSASGIVEMYERFKRQGKIDDDITVIAVSGDGGMDIGMDQVIGAAQRNDAFIMLEYDNKGYMNTGGQVCYSGIEGQINSNAHVGPQQVGKSGAHRDTLEILRGTYAPYLFHAAETKPQDMIKKARKAQEHVRNGNFVFGRFFSVCPLNWGMPAVKGMDAVQHAVDSCVFPLYEVENGVTTLNYDPERRNKKEPVEELLQNLGRAFAHLNSDQYPEQVQKIQNDVDQRWERIKAMDEAENL